MRTCLLMFFLLIIPATTTAQTPDDCDALTVDFLDHFGRALSADERLELLFEYLTFRLGCEPEPDCADLPARYAQRLADAQTRADLLIINAELSAALLRCTPADALQTIFADLGVNCSMLAADMDYIYAVCGGSPSLQTARALYAAALDYLGMDSIFFDLTLSDGDHIAQYIYTGSAWVVP